MIYIVDISPGNSLDYLTVKAFRILSSVDIGIYIGQMIGTEIKDLFKKDA